MQTEAQRTVNGLMRLPKHAPDGSDLARVFELHIPSGARKFPLRQGLWIEDLQTPPGQECSNGSMILLAVVLWRAFFWVRRRHLIRAVQGLANETSQDQNSALLPDNQRLRQAAGLHLVAETLRRPPPAVANQEQPCNDDPEE